MSDSDCLDGCPHSANCFYEPVKFYVDDKENPWRDTVADKVGATDEEIKEALKRGPYGRCVYKCDNDVVDRQVVNMEFEDGCTASFTMSSLNRGGRYMRVYGTKGDMVINMHTESTISLYRFENGETEHMDISKIDQGIASGHGGGDVGIMADTINSFANGINSPSVTPVRDSYMNHLICFAAEESRAKDIVVDMSNFEADI